MFKKIIKIKDIGNFNTFHAGDIKPFNDFNLIYGPNGSGKTTLVSIIRDLINNSSKNIEQRKSIKRKCDSTNEADPEVDLLFNTNNQNINYKYFNHNWNKQYIDNNVLIYDTHFVNNNIYSGFDFSSSHKKNLHKFVLGKKGKNLSQQIDKIKDRISNENKNMKTIKQKIRTKLDIKDVSKFLIIDKDTDLDTKISEFEKRLKFAKKQKDIQKKNSFSKININPLPSKKEKFINIINSELQEISEKYLKQFEKHKKGLKKAGLKNVESWINKGYNILDKDKIINKNLQNLECPFCKQNLNDTYDIIKSYNIFFNDEYMNLKKRAKELLENYNNYNIELTITNIENFIDKNQELYEFWNEYIEFENQLKKINIDENLEALYNEILTNLKTKHQNPLKNISDKNITSFFQKWDDLNNCIKKYNQNVEILNKEITQIKNRDYNISEIKESLNLLKTKRKRLTPAIEQLYKQYKIKDKFINKLNSIKSNKKKELQKFTTKTFELYSDNINKYLSEFSTSFRIENIESQYKGKSTEPYAEYTLTLNGKEINFKNNSNAINVKSCLSEGDKSSIAFAFFLAKLDTYENLQSKIIFIDDPITSFDIDRRNKTRKRILELAKKVKQIFILSHDKNFVFDLYDKIDNPKVFKIKYNGDIDIYKNIDKDMELPYYKNLRKINEFLNNPNEDNIQQLRSIIRNVIESNLKFRYYKHLKKKYKNKEGKEIGPINRKSTLPLMIKLLRLSDCDFKADKKEVLEELEELKNYAAPSHHSGIEEGYREQQTSVGELINHLKQTLNLVYNKL